MASCITLNDYRLAHKPKQWKCCHPKTHEPNGFAKRLYLSQTSKKEILLICSTRSYPPIDRQSRFGFVCLWSILAVLFLKA